MSAHPLLGVEHEEDDAEPFAQRVIGVLEYGACDDAETIAVLLVANDDLACLRFGRLLATLAEIMERTRLELIGFFATTRAFDDAIWPALQFQKCFAGRFIGKAGNQFAERHLLRIHVERIDEI